MIKRASMNFPVKQWYRGFESNLIRNLNQINPIFDKLIGFFVSEKQIANRLGSKIATYHGNKITSFFIAIYNFHNLTKAPLITYNIPDHPRRY